MATHSSVLAWKNPKDRGAWWATDREVTKSRIQLSELTLSLSVPMRHHATGRQFEEEESSPTGEN